MEREMAQPVRRDVLDDGVEAGSGDEKRPELKMKRRERTESGDDHPFHTTPGSLIRPSAQTAHHTELLHKHIFVPVRHIIY